MDIDEKQGTGEEKDYKVYIFAFQGVFVAVVLTALLIIKFLNADLFMKISAFYEENFGNDTSMQDIFGSYPEYSSFDGDDYTVYSE